MLKRLMVSILLSLGLVGLLDHSVLAGGLDFPEQGTRSLARGGAFSARADDPTAAFINPGALSKQRGYRLMYSHNLVWEFTEFTRSPSIIERPEYQMNTLKPGREADRIPNQRFDTVENTKRPFPYGLTFGATADFGLEDWTFALSVYGPNSNGSKEYGNEGGQRYMLHRLDTLLAYYGFSVAYGKKNFGVGATFQWVQMPYLDFALTIDAAPTDSKGGLLSNQELEDPSTGDLSVYGSTWDVNAEISLADHFAPSAIIGAWWQPIPSIELSLSGRVLPIYLNAEGPVDLDILGEAIKDIPINVNNASLDIVLPPTGRFGIRYRHLKGNREVFDIEANVVYEAWSTLDKYDVRIDAEPIELGVSSFNLDRVVIEKNWQDTWSVRLGGTWNAMPDVFDVSMGGFWEQGAAPKEHYHLDFPSADRIGVGSGFSVALGKSSSVKLTVSYLYVKLDDVSVSAAEGRVFQQRPLGPCTETNPCLYGENLENSLTQNPVANAGDYKSEFHQFALGIDATF